MIIREVKLSDLKEISKIYQHEMKKHFRDIGEEPLLADNYCKILNSNAKDSNMYVIDDGSIKGFLWYDQDGKEFNLEEVFVIDKRIK
jgi:hypothetical protein